MEEMMNNVINEENELAVTENSSELDSTETFKDFDVTDVETDDKHSCGKAVGLILGGGAALIGAAFAFKRSKLYQKLKAKKETNKTVKNARFINDVSLIAQDELSADEIEELVAILQATQRIKSCNNDEVETSFTTEEVEEDITDV